MSKTLKLALLGAVIMMSGAAPAQRYTAGGLARSNITYTTLGEVSSGKTSDYSGVGTLFISYVSTARDNIGAICTGSLVGSGTVLTAGHCLSTAADNPITSIRFYLPSLGAGIAGGAKAVEIYNASAFAINPLYASNGGLVGGNDVALFSIGKTTGHDIYSLFTDNPLQQFTFVGTGTVGGPQGTGIGVTNDFQKRAGTNTYELYGDQLFTDVGHGVALFDFDDGTAAHDVFGRNLGLVGKGVAGEANTSPGDSGGPSFIDGKIAAVTSFGITGGIFQGYCGSDSTDPFNNSGGTAKTSLGNCTNSSVGEISGNTLVANNADFIKGYLNGTVATVAPLPEPGSWALLISGFGVVGRTLRRRRAKDGVRATA